MPYASLGGPKILPEHPPGPHIGAQGQRGQEQLHLPAAGAGLAPREVVGGLEQP